jgi:hypothetical protein
LSQVGEGFAKVVDKNLLAPTLHNNVVDVGFNVAADLGAKAFPHHSVESGSCIFEPKGHASVAEVAYQRDEHRLLLVFDRHFDLVVAGEIVEEAKQVTASHGIHDLINAR